MYHLSSYSLLLSPKYRILRYVLLCTALFIFGYSETSYHYPEIDMFPFMALVLNGFLSKFILSVILVVALIPLLLSRRYMLFWILILTLIFIFVWLEDLVLENWICGYFNLHSWNENIHFIHILIDGLSQSALWFMVVLGVLMGRMMKYWVKEYEAKQQIQVSGLQMESETMKEQVSPTLLCSTLRLCGGSAEAAPEETSDTLMRLSRLLRYQLYDCRQEKVWLDSEIKFLKEYLSILRYNAGCSDFSILVSGQTLGILVPPLLFVPFLQSDEVSERNVFVNISIRVQENILTFELTDNHMKRNDKNVRQRLEQIYPQRYSLVIEPKYVILEIQL